MKTTDDLIDPDEIDLEAEALQMIEAWGTALRERNEARETAMRLEEELARTHREPKPDGWHTYHVCGDVLREISKVGGRDGSSSLYCAVCNEWYDWYITPQVMRP